MQEKQSIESYIDAYNAFDVDGMIQHLDEDLIFENHTNGTVNLRTEGKKAFAEQAESAMKYFKQRKQTITAWSFDQQEITVEVDYKATLALDLPNGLKAGNVIALKGKSVFQFNAGKISRIIDIS